MAAATVDHHHPLHLNSLPLIDLRLLSHSELLSLSLYSSSTSSAIADNGIKYDADDEDSTPKIDASVFNESAGSRKQTFSRLRLAPRNSSPLPPQIPSPAPVKSLDEENLQIVSLLKSLLNIQSHSSTAIYDVYDEDEDDQLIPVPVEFEDLSNSKENGSIGLQTIPVELVTCSEMKRRRGRPRKDERDCRWLITSENGVKEIDKNMIVDVVNDSSQNTPIEKRKRGRPRKNVRIKDGIINNMMVVESPIGTVGSETVKRKRGRPRKNESGGMKMAVASQSSHNVVSRDGVTCETRKRRPGRPRKDEKMRENQLVDRMDGENKMEIVVQEEKQEMVMENGNGVVVNLVPLATVADPFWEELRRAEGTEKDDELLGFWRGSNGEW